MRARVWALLATIMVLGFGSATLFRGDVSGSSAAVLPAGDLTLPVRATFFYPWFPEAWNQSGINPYTHYHPSLGSYSSTNTTVLQAQIRAMEYANIQAGIVSWWGQGTTSDNRMPTLFSTTHALGSGFRWSVYYEAEAQGDPTVSQITSDLTYLKTKYASDPDYLTVGGKFVVFVFSSTTDGCGMADRWKQANTVGAYVVLKVFSGYATCASQPDNWHQYAPAGAASSQAGHSYSISPGFWKANETTPRLTRDLTRWNTNIQNMVASNAPWQLVTTFNEWGEGTAVESASEWADTSGYGDYIDALHNDGGTVISPPPTTTTTPPPTTTTTPPPTTTVTPPPTTTTTPPPNDPVIAAAGDIACDTLTIASTSCHMAATSNLMVNTGLTSVLTLGDDQYEVGALSAYQAYFQPTWGRLKSIMHPAIGNHEYGTTGASGYFDYFGSIGGAVGKAYYSYNIGTWHLIALNSNCSEVGGCGAGSPQEVWLKADLAAHPTPCTIAYWHHPRFSSGQHGDNTTVGPLWTDLYNANADIVLNGHDHDYERFGPQTPSGAADSVRGIREFVVGTGGKNHYAFPSTTFQPNSQAHNDSTFGVLRLTLHASSYDWKFLPESGKTFTDSGTTACH